MERSETAHQVTAESWFLPLTGTCDATAMTSSSYYSPAAEQADHGFIRYTDVIFEYVSVESALACGAFVAGVR